MRHYTMEKWVDFARGVLNEQERVAMKSHLDGGCRACKDILRLWERVHAMGRQERAYEPPESTVREIRAKYALHGPRGIQPKARAAASLLFDSFLTPLAEGVRSAAPVTRQLLYGIGEYRIDLRMEHQAESGTISLIGQILDSSAPEGGTSAILVRLLVGSETVAESKPNQFGEFRLETNSQGPFLLSVQLSAGELRIPQIETSQGSSSNGPQVVEPKQDRKRRKSVKRSTRKKV